MSTTVQERVRVLHVDDDPEFRDLTATFLEREDDRLTVETVPGASDGLEMIDESSPDCIVSDYNMPGMDGLEFLEAVRAEYPDLPFILFTGKGSEEVAGRAISAGVTDYLQKQAGGEQYGLLANRIRNAVRAKRDARRAARQEELMRLTEFAGDTGGFELDLETGNVVHTDGARRILNYDDDAELTLENGLAMFHPEDRAEIEEVIDRAVETAEETRGTWRYQHPDGEERLLNITFTPPRTDGDTTKLRGAIHDVTEHRRRDRRFQALVEESNDIISVVDTQGVYQYQSPSIERILGYDPEETVGDAAWEYIHPDDIDSVMETFEEWVENQEMTATVEYRARHADGSYRWMEARGNNQLDNPSVEGYVVNSRDITDRKANEHELTQIRNLMSNMETLADVGAWEYDREEETLVMTEGACQLYGIDPETELSLVESFEYIHPADRETFTDRFTDCLETGTPYELDIRLLSADGVQRWVTARGERIQGNEDGTVVRGYIRDITEQRDRERDLKRYRNIFNELPDPVAVYDDTGQYELVNEAATEIRDMSRQELVGTLCPYLERIRTEHSSAYDALVEGDRETLEIELTDEFSGRGKRTLECRLSRVTAGMDSHGTVVVTRDLTDRKAREQELEEIKGQYQTLVENFPDGAVFLFDSELRTIRAAGEELAAVGLSTDELRGTTPHDTFPAEIADELVSYFEKALNGEPATFEQEYLGERYRIQTAPVRTGDGEITHGMAVSQNITEQTADRMELERQNERLEEFTSLVSHDLRNPLTVAESRIELTQETCESDHLDRAADAIDRSQTLIDDLLTLAREGDGVTDVEPVDLAAVAESSWQNVDTRTARLEIDAQRVVRADRSRLQQLFENLYRNAVEHGSAGSQTEQDAVKHSAASPDSQPPQRAEESSDVVTVSVGETDSGFYVADTGPGIPESEREDVFSAGYSTNETGTGFGLRIVEQVAEAHGWEIAVTDAEGGGARFEITGVESPGN